MFKILTNHSKQTVLGLLSLILLVIWDGNNSPINEFYYVPSQQGAMYRPESVWESMGRAFTLNHKTNTVAVQREINRFVNDHERLTQILQAAGPYIYYIYKQTRERGLPAELALIPAIESEFNPNDHSNKGATGLWQLMPQTARDLGVQVKSNYDGRRNVIDSTKAALVYFNDLVNNFNGDWYLAIAAYNCGPMRVASAEHRTGSQSFWDLPLPRDTQYYVPRLLAIAAIVQNPQKYGVKLPPITNKPYFTQVPVSKPVNLNQVAKSSGVNLKTLAALNPDIKQNNVPANKANSTLLVPVTHAPKITAVLSSKMT